MKIKTTRRSFLKSALVGGGGLLILRESRSARSYAANEKLNIALVGVGGRGKWFVDSIPKLGENVVALCDVNEEKAAEAFQKFPDLPKFPDYRKMLEKMDKEIDALIIATPDHSHAPCSVMAMKMGKHVYCEKPLTQSVRQSRVVRDVARGAGVATQMGNQGTASGEYRRGVELIRAGVIGDVPEVMVWNESGGPGKRGVPEEDHPIPEYLQWDLWLGPAAFRPYHPEWMKWHCWREFGTGQLGNWASHSVNLAFMALEVDSLWHEAPNSTPPIRIEARVSEINTLSFPRWEIIRYEIPARGDVPPVTLTWYNGSSAPEGRQFIEERLGRRLDWGDAGERKWRDHAGALIIGAEGNIHATGHNATFTLLPESKFESFEGPPQSIPRSPGHEREWIDACKGGPTAMSNFEYAAPLAQFLLLGNVATQFEGPLDFDPVAGRIVNNDDADAALFSEYREGWRF